IGRVREVLNPRLVVDGLVLTMFDGRNSLARQVKDEVRTHFGAQVFQTVVPRNVRLSESPSHGVPVLLYDPTSRGARAYRELAQELLAATRAERVPIASSPRSFSRRTARSPQRPVRRWSLADIQAIFGGSNA